MTAAAIRIDLTTSDEAFRRDLARAYERVRKAGGMGIDIFVIERQRVGEMHQQTAEQCGVHARR